MTKTDIENLFSKINAFKKKQQRLEDMQSTSSHSVTSKGFQLFIEFTSAVFVAIAIGFFLDYLLGTHPFFLVILAVLGCAAGVLNVYRFAKADEKEGA